MLTKNNDMKPKFNINNYEVCMHCGTKEKDEIFLRYLDSIGLTWISGTTYIDHDTDKVYYPFIYMHDRNKVVFYFLSGRFGELEFAKKRGDTILEFDDFDWDNCNEH